MGAEGKSERSDLEREKQIQDAEVWNWLKKEKMAIRAGGEAGRTAIPYVVLGLIVAKAFRTNVRRILRARIFTPLKNESHIVSEKGKKRSRERRVRPLQKKTTRSRIGSERNFRDARDGGIYSNLEISPSG